MREPAPLDSLSIGQTTRNPAGIVVVQVERVTTQHVLALRNVHSPGIFVDGLVIARQTAQMDDQQQLSSVLLESRRPSRLSTATRR